MLAVPDPHASIKPVAQDADLAVGVAEDQRCRPLAAARSRHTLGVETDGNRPRRSAVCIITEDSTNDGSLLRDNLHLAGSGQAIWPDLPAHPVAKAQPAAAASGAHPPLQAPMRLLSEILQEQRGHRALEADMQFTDLALGDRHQLHAGKAEVFVEAGDVFLVTADPVQRFRQNDIEAADPGIRQQGQELWSLYRRAAEGIVGIYLDDDPALALGPGAANPSPGPRSMPRADCPNCIEHRSPHACLSHPRCDGRRGPVHDRKHQLVRAVSGSSADAAAKPSKTAHDCSAARMYARSHDRECSV